MSRRGFVLTLAMFLLSVPAIAQERALTGEEIRNIFDGTVSYGYHLKYKMKMKIEFMQNGNLNILYNYDARRPIQIRGIWDIEENNWCRKMSPPAENTTRQCQKIIEDNGSYYFVDSDGYRSSRIFKGDIKRR